MFCRYKNLLGKVNTGLHSYRLFNIAILDVILTFLGALIIYKIKPNYKFINILTILFLLGIVLHRLFCVETTIDRLLFK
jgi:hypothetical protein